MDRSENFAFPSSDVKAKKLITFCLRTESPGWLMPFVRSWVGPYRGVGVIVFGLVGLMIDQGANGRFAVRVTPFETRRIHVLGETWSVSLFVSFNPFRPLKKSS